MSQINLLPWREELRQQRKQRFLQALSGSAILSILAVISVHWAMSINIRGQEERAQILNQEIVILDGQIKEIKDIKEEKAKLLARMQIIQDLQTDRAYTVHMFDEIAKIVPEGAYLTSMTREEDQISLEGQSEANSWVSQLMRNMESSQWLSLPVLNEIKTNDGQAVYSRDFKLKLQQKNKRLAANKATSTVTQAAVSGTPSAQDNNKSSAKTGDSHHEHGAK